jgi:hypothetical protein
MAMPEPLERWQCCLVGGKIGVGAAFRKSLIYLPFILGRRK